MPHIYPNIELSITAVENKSFKDLFEVVGISIDDIKIILASIIAQLISQQGRLGNEHNEEIYGFVRFIDDAYSVAQQRSQYYPTKDELKNM